MRNFQDTFEKRKQSFISAFQFKSLQLSKLYVVPIKSDHKVKKIFGDSK